MPCDAQKGWHKARREAPLSQRDKACAAALSPRVGRHATALDVAIACGDAAKASNAQKLDLPLQLGKETLNPKDTMSFQMVIPPFSAMTGLRPIPGSPRFVAPQNA
ncbi:hypothetical protein HAX54_022368 [Datura stramonium]|uniref:Uncharacterized protein n=1 Tax=Datura stramonium TaxID=4076 RepID=A0ABS8UWN3_DATST|nr:hypothetical protein [Datura stramonium]